MRHEIVNVPVDPTLIPEAAHKFAQQALREHQRAEKDVMKAVEHIVKSGQALLKAYDLCEYGQWVGFFEMHFGEKTAREDGTRPLTLRTAQRYMQLARDWSRLLAEHPQGFSSQRQAFKALAAIARADENCQPKAIGGKGAARCANGGKRARTGRVWRASGPFVNEALGLITSIDATLEKLVDEGFPLEAEAHQVHAALERLRTMLEREIDEAEALEAAQQGKFVDDFCGAGVSPASKEQAGRLLHNSDDAALTLELESEAGDDD